MQKPLARLLLGWLLMLVGGCLLLESGLADNRNPNRTLPAVEAVAGFGLAVGGVILRRAAVKRSPR